MVAARFGGAQAALILTTLLISGSAFGQQTLVMNAPTDPPLTNEARTGFLDVLATEALRRIGVELEIIKLPAERALINANAGIDDGDVNRIAGLEKVYPNLVRVPEKNLDMHFVAFTRHVDIQIDGWQALKPYSIGIIKGWKILENNIPGEATVTLAEDAEQLFRLLEKDRVDVVLYGRWRGLARIKRDKLSGVRVLTPPLVTKEMFMYLHKKHKHLVPKIAAALRAMKAEGTYQRLFQEKVAPLATQD